MYFVHELLRHVLTKAKATRLLSLRSSLAPWCEAPPPWPVGSEGRCRATGTGHVGTGWCGQVDRQLGEWAPAAIAQVLSLKSTPESLRVARDHRTLVVEGF